MLYKYSIFIDMAFLSFVFFIIQMVHVFAYSNKISDKENHRMFMPCIMLFAISSFTSICYLEPIIAFLARGGKINTNVITLMIGIYFVINHIFLFRKEIKKDPSIAVNNFCRRPAQIILYFLLISWLLHSPVMFHLVAPTPSN